ncbi:MAG: hypothetical protein RMK20_13225, partial [Verrucomicrobiales bacterium]|nr:hypothetical protein [Verrucomicrobiales bacterium]
MNRRRSADDAAVCLRRFFRSVSSASLGAAWLVLCAPASGAARDIHATTPNAPATEQAAIEEGRALARELLSLQPAETTVQSGVLRIWESRKLRAVVPVRVSVLLTPTHWLTVYETVPTNAAPQDLPLTNAPRADTPRSDAPRSNAPTVQERLTVTHCANAPNRYELEAHHGQTAERRTLSGDELMRPFADSDFWIADLGLE